MGVGLVRGEGWSLSIISDTNKDFGLDRSIIIIYGTREPNWPGQKRVHEVDQIAATASQDGSQTQVPRSRSSRPVTPISSHPRTAVIRKTLTSNDVSINQIFSIQQHSQLPRRKRSRDLLHRRTICHQTRRQLCPEHPLLLILHQRVTLSL